MLPSGHAARRPDPVARRSTGRRACSSTARTSCTAWASPGAAPPSAIIGRMRAAIPGRVTIDLVFDGMGHGVFGRLAQGMTVRYSGKRSADDVILDLMSEAAMEPGAAGGRARSWSSPTTASCATGSTRRAPGRRPVQWLIGRLDVPMLPSAAPGNRSRAARSVRGRPPKADAADDDRRSARAGSRAAARPRRPAPRGRSRATSGTRARRLRARCRTAPARRRPRTSMRP